MSDQLRPNDAELAFLELAYNRFYDLYDEVMDQSFWENDDWYRFSRIASGFSIYTELLQYKPIQWYIDHLRRTRPPMEAEIGNKLFQFVRNVITHFPFHEKWDDVWVSKRLVNWESDGRSFDQFLEEYAGHDPIKYRIWEAKYEKMTYLSISFPESYKSSSKIYLSDILSEQEGVKFSFTLMKRIVDSQVVQE